MPPTTSDSEGPTKEEFTFLVIFFGVTPFSILGIHDFFIGRKLQGLLHLIALMVAVLAQTLPLTIGLVADVSKANIQNRPFFDNALEWIMYNLPGIIIVCSWLVGIGEVIAYLIKDNHLPLRWRFFKRSAKQTIQKYTGKKNKKITPLAGVIFYA